MIEFKLASLGIVLILQLAIFQNSQAFEQGAPYYDPELQDGIPVMSAKSLAPSMKWRFDEHELPQASASSMPSRRRSSDSDLDDATEDDDEDDRDEYSRAGSSNHDSYENPAFGESRTAAKDGEDIESFFDKHLGPPQDVTSNSDTDSLGTTEVPINEVATRPLASDYDDHFETAASSPLTTIFQTILNAHKRPLVIHAEDASSSAGSDPDVKDNNAASSSTLMGSSAIKLQLPISTSASQTYADASPIAFFTPLAASASSASGYDSESVNQAVDGRDSGVREIIISRRPASSFINHLHGGRLVHQSSNDNWRGMSSAASRPYQGADYQQEYQAQDYPRYPAVAASYAYQKEQSQPADEEQTVSYGLSFGGGGASDEDSTNPEEQANAMANDDTAQPGASYRSNPMRHSSSMLRAYNNYQQVPVQYMPMYSRHQQQQYYQQQAMMQPQQQQSAYNGARYHKDPSESAVQPVSYGQYSSQSSNNNNVGWLQRQQLLANLDKQLKLNAYYKQQQQQQQQQEPTSQQSSNSYSHQRHNQQTGNNYQQSSQHAKGQLAGKQAPMDDVDTYSSFHSEVDPFKSFTSSSHIVSEPIVAQHGPNVDSRLSSATMGQLSSVTNNQLAARHYDINNNNAEYSNYPYHRKQQQQQHQPPDKLLTGPISNFVSDPQNQLLAQEQLSPSLSQLSPGAGAMLRKSNDMIDTTDNSNNSNNSQQNVVVNSRVRRDDSDDRESDDADDDGVWVDDDEDDDNRQQSSDLNETAQEPDDDEDQQNDGSRVPGAVGAVHGYELSPDDLLVYHSGK